jgi:hypothetical protein
VMACCSKDRLRCPSICAPKPQSARCIHVRALDQRQPEVPHPLILTKFGSSRCEDPFPLRLQRLAEQALVTQKVICAAVGTHCKQPADRGRRPGSRRISVDSSRRLGIQSAAERADAVWPVTARTVPQAGVRFQPHSFTIFGLIACFWPVRLAGARQSIT